MAFKIADSERLQKLAQTLKSAKLVDVRTFLLHAKVLDIEAADELQDIDELNTKLGIGREGRHLSYQFEHRFTVKGAGGVDALEIEVHLGALFEFPAEDEPGGKVSDDSLIAYGQTAAHLAVHPYLRAAVADLTSRLGCSRLTLSLLKA